MRTGYVLLHTARRYARYSLAALRVFLSVESIESLGTLCSNGRIIQANPLGKPRDNDTDRHSAKTPPSTAFKFQYA